LLRLSEIVAASLVTLLPCAIHAQQDSGSIPVAPEDRSFYLGQQVTHPESLSGIWETSNGHGGAIGIHLELDTTIPSDGDKQIWAPQSWQDLQVGVFERKGAEIQLGEESGFSDSRSGGSVTFDQGRLQLHFVSQWADTPSVDLDLVQQADGCWDGRLHRGDFDSHVTLCRPSTGQSGKASPLVGTWRRTRASVEAVSTLSSRRQANSSDGPTTSNYRTLSAPASITFPGPLPSLSTLANASRPISKRTAASPSSSTPIPECVVPTRSSESSLRAEI